MSREPHRIKLYNLPQRTTRDIRIHGMKGRNDEDIVLRFHHLDGMYSRCTIEGTKEVVPLSATTPLVEMGNDEYRIDEEAEHADAPKA